MSDSSIGSITRGGRDLEAGGRPEDAAQGLWDRLYAELAAFALRQVRARRADHLVDGEEAASCALERAFRLISGGAVKFTDRVHLKNHLFNDTFSKVMKMFRSSRAL